jgi:hypothetical protein
MNKLFSSIVACVLLAVICPAAGAPKLREALPAPTVRPAIDGILAGFQNHPLVAIGNHEDYAQQEDFYAALVRDPRFAREVGNVVVEFGAGGHQDIIDRFLNGGDVSFSELRKVWSDIVGFNIPYAIGYVNFFVQVREVNRTLPRNQRIHVWLGEPPIDWSKIKNKAELVRYYPQRETHPAEIIEKEILARHKKALVIYGGGHFYAVDGHTPMLSLVEKKYPNSTFIVEMYTGFTSKACTERFEQSVRSWPTPALVTPVRGSSLEEKMRRPGCDVVSRDEFTFPPSFTETKKAQIISQFERLLGGLNANALLYLGKAAGLTQSPYEPSIYLDPDYRREMNRRVGLGFEFELDGSPIGSVRMTDSFVQKNPASPKYIRHY